MPDTSGFKRDVVGSYIEKDPVAVLTYTVSWINWLESGVSLATSEFTTSTIANDPSGIVVSSPVVVDGNKATISLSGGSAGNTYTITNTVTTNNGQTDSRRFRVDVRERVL